jgi:TPR repeat protein
MQVFQMVTSGTNMPVLEDDPFTQFFEMCVRENPDERGTIGDILHWLDEAADFFPTIDRAKFEAYRQKLARGPQLPTPTTVADVQDLANRRYFKAKFLLARLLERGGVIPQDLEEAAKLFRELAFEGEAQAAQALLNMFERRAVAARGWDEVERLKNVKNCGRESAQQVGTGLQFRLRTLVEFFKSAEGPWASHG